MTKSQVIDTHCHLFSPEMVKAIHAETPYEAAADLDLGVISNFLGLQLPLQTESDRAEEGRAFGVDIQVISVRTSALFSPEVLDRSPHDRMKLGQVVNSHLARVVKEHDGFFRAFADVPFSPGEPALGTTEAVRALDEDNLHGVMLYTNYGGRYLDAPEFQELFEELDKRGCVIFLHPSVVQGAPGVNDNRMYSMVGFPFDTTLCVTRMVYAGLFDKYRNIKLITSHAGGAIPFLWWRLGLGYRQNYLDVQSRLDRSPADYFSEIYYDTALVDKDALEMAYSRVGPRIIFGTDHPYSPNGISRTLETVAELDIDAEARANILGRTAASLLGLESSI